MKKMAVVCLVLCCMMALGCSSKERAEVMSSEVELSQNMSKDEAICREIINAYLLQQLTFDNTKIRDLNSHIVSIQNIANKKMRDVFFEKKGSSDFPFSDLMLDRTTDKDVMRDYICKDFLLPTVAAGNRTGGGKHYKKIFTRSQADEIADEYIKLYGLTKFNIQRDDTIKDKDEYVKTFKNFLKDVDPDEVYFFKISVEYVDFNFINNTITERVINEFIKDPKIVLHNERMKNGKTTPPNTLDKFIGEIKFFNEHLTGTSTDEKYMSDKMKKLFIDVLKDNEANPKMEQDDFYVCMYAKPMLEFGQKVFLVSEIYDTINEPSEQRSVDGLSVYRTDQTEVRRPFIFSDIDSHIWGDFIGNISKTNENILFKVPKKTKISGPTISVLDIQPEKNQGEHSKHYKLKISLSNDTSEGIRNTGKFELKDSYDDYIGEIVEKGSKEWISKDKNGISYVAGRIHKSDYDKFTDDELDMLTGVKPIPPKRSFEFTKIISVSKKDLTSGDIWLVYSNPNTDFYWETKLNVQ